MFWLTYSQADQGAAATPNSTFAGTSPKAADMNGYFVYRNAFGGHSREWITVAFVDNWATFDDEQLRAQNHTHTTDLSIIP